MERYKSYKPSSNEWIGDIPQHWDIARLKFAVLVNPAVKNFDLSKRVDDEVVFLPMERVSENGSVNQELRKRVGDASSGFTYFERSDIIVAKITPCFENGKGALLDGLETDFGFGSTEFHTLRTSERVLSKFLYYVVTAEPFRSIGTAFMSGSAGQKRVSADFVRDFPLILPPLQEQTAISNFLDSKIEEIDRLIDNKQKMIELLKEERMAIINRAVTRGINSDVKLKPSGIEWLGDIPVHWHVTRIKYVCKVQGRIGFKGYKSSDLVSGGEGALTFGASHITRDHKIDITSPVYLSWEKYYESPEIMVKTGNIVFTQRGAYLGKVALINKDYGAATINPSLILLKEILIDGGFLTYYLTSNYIRKTIELISSSTAIPMISQESLANFYCVVPSSRTEQSAISRFIEDQVLKFDQAIYKIEREIELMSEYRTALISAAVTGKIKVV